MTIQGQIDDRAQICEDIPRSLQEWFGIENAVKNYIKDAQSRPMFIAKDGDNVAGFLSLTTHHVL